VIPLDQDSSAPPSSQEEINLEIKMVLNEWRRRALDILYRVIAFIGLAALIVQIIADKTLLTLDLGITVVFLLLYGVYLWITFDRSLNMRVRGWTLLGVLYTLGVISMLRGGLSGDGRLLLFTLPIVAVILVDLKAAYIMVSLSIVTVVGFMALAGSQFSDQFLLETLKIYPLSPETWIAEGLYTILIYLIAFSLIVVFFRFMLQLIRDQLSAQKELKQAHQLLEEYNQKLEEKVASRTVELNQAVEQAQEARKAAEKANRAKSSFLATMSHELRTPLNGIIGMTALLTDTPLTLKQKEFTEVIHQSGETLLSLINDILDFSKIEAGRMEIYYRPFNLRHCIESLVNLVAPRAAEKNLNLACFFEEGVPQSIISDETRLKQILLNLLSNAVKFTEHGEVTLTVSAERLDTARTLPAVKTSGAELVHYTLHFVVHDTGIGIAPENLPRLFKPFSQIDNPSIQHSSGTGLGLAISQRLVERLGGSIGVESLPGQGSTFWLKIQAIESTIQPPLAQNQNNLQNTGKRLLIVDENPTNRRILTLQVQAWGMEAQPASRPEEALMWLRKGETFHAALIDMQMSEMDGYTLAEEIRQIPQHSELPLVLLTSLNSEEHLSENGVFRSVLTKPVKTSALYNTLIGLFSSEIEAALRDPSPASTSLFDSHLGERHPLRLLLVEDNTINQNLVTLILERLGYHAAIASNGKEAIDTLRQNRYDVVLMDVQMPELDGLEATRQIRRNFPREAQPHIIAMTANAMTGDREACLQAGMNDYLSKPINVQALSRSLELARPLAPGSNWQEAAVRQADDSQDEQEATQPLVLILDFKELDQLKAVLGNRAPEMMPNLILNFNRQAVKLMDDLEIALQNHSLPGSAQPFTEIRRLAHTLKSNSTSFGAMRLANAAREIEELARQGILAGIPGLLHRCREEYAQVKTALEQYPPQ